MADDQFSLGRHEALIERLVIGQEQLVERVTSIEHMLAEGRGERRVALWAASAGGGILATLVAFILRKLGIAS